MPKYSSSNSYTSLLNERLQIYGIETLHDDEIISLITGIKLVSDINMTFDTFLEFLKQPIDWR